MCCCWRHVCGLLVPFSSAVLWEWGAKIVRLNETTEDSNANTWHIQWKNAFLTISLQEFNQTCTYWHYLFKACCTIIRRWFVQPLYWMITCIDDHTYHKSVLLCKLNLVTMLFVVGHGVLSTGRSCSFGPISRSESKDMTFVLMVHYLWARLHLRIEFLCLSPLLEHYN